MFGMTCYARQLSLEIFVEMLSYHYRCKYQQQYNLGSNEHLKVQFKACDGQTQVHCFSPVLLWTCCKTCSCHCKWCWADSGSSVSPGTVANKLPLSGPSSGGRGAEEDVMEWREGGWADGRAVLQEGWPGEGGEAGIWQIWCIQPPIPGCTAFIQAMTGCPDLCLLSSWCRSEEPHQPYWDLPWGKREHPPCPVVHCRAAF